jgi:hypothetical protein
MPLRAKLLVQAINMHRPDAISGVERGGLECNRCFTGMYYASQSLFTDAPTAEQNQQERHKKTGPRPAFL